MHKIGRQAVVLGGGMSGLLAAGVLAEAYDNVKVIERDSLPDTPQSRRGTPQDRHIHTLHYPGKHLLDETFPGIVEEMVKDGMPSAATLEQLSITISGRTVTRASTGEWVPVASRPFLEYHVRRRVRALPNVEIIDGTDVAGLTADEAGARITGVEVGGGTTGTIEADLVVDAMGRGGRTPQWLTRLGYPAPAEEEVRVLLCYTSRVLRLPAGALGDDKIVVVGPKPGFPRGLGLFSIEGGRWICSLMGIAGEKPPGEREKFVEYAASVVPPAIATAIREAEFLSEPSSYQLPISRWRRYDKLRRFPDGLLVIGDAICSFNPIYGQGMTVAAREAAALRRCLADGEANLARRFFTAAKAVVQPAWQLSTGADLALPEIKAPRPLPVRIIGAYMNRLQSRLPYDPVIADRFNRVVSLERPPQSLMTPSTLLRVLAGRRRPASPAPGTAAVV